MSAASVGSLYLIPVGLGPSNAACTHPPEVLVRLRLIQHFIVERAKTARADLKRLGHPLPLQSLDIAELPEKLSTEVAQQLLVPAVNGQDVGLMSEAGCPAVADPGALIVRSAHSLGIRVVPLVGPSSLLLALMASGLNGQSFAFHGYLPIDTSERQRSLKQLEAESARFGRTQLFIETPYRNEAMFDAILQACSPNTMLCVARSLSTEHEWVKTARIDDWRRAPRADLARQPTVFLLLAY